MSLPNLLLALSLASVTHYDADLALDVRNGRIAGVVWLTLLGSGDGAETATLDSGELTIESVTHEGRALAFETAERRVTFRLPERLRQGRRTRVELRYSGQPRRGLRFLKEESQAYTVFSTSQWMPVEDAPDRKATLRLRLDVPRGLTAVASGRFVGRRDTPAGGSVFEWSQERPLPTYVFGFAAGPYRTVSETHRGVRLDYMSATRPDAELRRIFAETKGMLEFFEDKAGLRYPGKVYAQVLAAGRVEQEVGSFTLLGDAYGTRVLEDPTDVWLMAHELAHQWWGNGVTCRDWNHFWLNEGLATFLASAYREHRFGAAAYAQDVERWRARHEKIRAQGEDKPLVFPDWKSPTANDRALVYDKGAYVAHLLRQELGDARFWAGLRAYTKRYMGRSVTTPDFQRAMQDGSGRDLREFFERWVYGAN